MGVVFTPEDFTPVRLHAREQRIVDATRYAAGGKREIKRRPLGRQVQSAAGVFAHGFELGRVHPEAQA